MKTANLPSLRVEPELRDAVESVLAKGESVSSFIETAVRGTIRRRQVQAEFVARGLASFVDMERTGVSYSKEEVHARLTAMLEVRRAQLASGPDSPQGQR